MSEVYIIHSCHKCEYFQWDSIYQRANCLQNPGNYFNPQNGFPEFCKLLDAKILKEKINHGD